MIELNIIKPYTTRVLVPVTSVVWWTPETRGDLTGPTKIRMADGAALPPKQEGYSSHREVTVAESILDIAAAMQSAGLDVIRPGQTRQERDLEP